MELFYWRLSTATGAQTDRQGRSSSIKSSYPEPMKTKPLPVQPYHATLCLLETIRLYDKRKADGKGNTTLMFWRKTIILNQAHIYTISV